MSQRRPFIVLALPRSRTAWLSHWLNYSPRRVGHDVSIMADNPGQIVDAYKSGFMDGTVETAGMIGWRLLRHHLPKLKTLVIRRDLNEVLGSLERFGIAGPELMQEMASRAMMLDAISMEKGVETFGFEALHSLAVREHIFEGLLGLPFDYEWDARLVPQNIQIDMQARIMQLQNRAPKLAALKAEIIAQQHALKANETCRLFN